ncbi:hypothetical protein [Mycobacterium colombiense]|uniref:hypothetical protein n=1 Tax=Mycobacterium colombiense TaxID=339268 RepID=UPI00200B8CC2|nr:hypothetical protein [Mycobacterium colombiense]MCK8643578.1 hypothetical protein [Mycobacterium colombiense]
MDDTGRSRRVIRALGVRECGHGVALLGGPAKLVWTRVAGDVLDMALLIARGPGRRRQGAISATLLSGIAGLDLYTALRTSGARRRAPQLRAV